MRNGGIFGNDDPGKRRFGEQAPRDEARGRRRHLDALVAARTRIFDSLMLDHAHLLRDIELLAQLNTDLDEHLAVMRAYALGLGQRVANYLAR
jgi:hypothetical protein